MKIEINDTISIDCTNGYYNVHTYSLAKSGKSKGDKIKCGMKTYPNIFGAWDRLKELGVDSNKALANLENAKKMDRVIISKEALEKRKVKA